jgi:hypothetical protein
MGKLPASNNDAASSIMAMKKSGIIIDADTFRWPSERISAFSFVKAD